MRRNVLLQPVVRERFQGEKRPCFPRRCQPVAVPNLTVIWAGVVRPQQRKFGCMRFVHNSGLDVSIASLHLTVETTWSCNGNNDE
jgi:hypothetical protein